MISTRPPELLMNWILITMTFLGGASWGPGISMGAFQTKALCEAGAQATLEMFEEMSKTNLRGGRSQRDILSTRCLPAATDALHVNAAKKN
jgi:hypothetical protein